MDCRRVIPVVPLCRGFEMGLTALSIQVPEGYIAFVEESPGANTQGVALDEARDNLKETVQLVISHVE